MHSSANARENRCQFHTELRKPYSETGCDVDVPVTCQGVGLALDRVAWRSTPG